MADDKKKKKDKSALDYFKDAYDSAAKSGMLGTRAQVTAEEEAKGRGAEWYTGKKKKKSSD